jgi:hypothetical protein
MSETDYMGVDTREYGDAIDEDGQVVVAFTHEHYGRLRFPLESDTAEQLADDVDSAIDQLVGGEDE